MMYFGQNSSKELMIMITDIAWNAFKKTGDINMYLEFKEIKNIEENIRENLDETNKSQWSNFS